MNHSVAQDPFTKDRILALRRDSRILHVTEAEHKGLLVVTIFYHGLLTPGKTCKELTDRVFEILAIPPEIDKFLDSLEWCFCSDCRFSYVHYEFNPQAHWGLNEIDFYFAYEKALKTKYNVQSQL